jgi:hypothetical protein
MTAGQAHDRQIADALLDHLGPRTIALTDKAYDGGFADDLRQQMRPKTLPIAGEEGD